MRNGILPRRTPPLKRPNRPTDPTRLLFPRTCARKVVMNYIAGQNCLGAVYHKKWCESGCVVWRGPQPLEYGVELLYPVRVRFRVGPH